MNKVSSPLMLVSYCNVVFESGAVCPQYPPDVFDPWDDVIINSYHQSVARTTNGYVTWGEDIF